MKSNLGVANLPRISSQEFVIARQESMASALKLRLVDGLNGKQITTLRDLTVHVYEGEVTVTGEVDSYYHRQVAINVCLNTWGLVKLIDQIHVRHD